MTPFQVGAIKGFVLGNIVGWTVFAILALITHHELMSGLGIFMLIPSYLAWGKVQYIRASDDTNGEDA